MIPKSLIKTGIFHIMV